MRNRMNRVAACLAAICSLLGAVLQAAEVLPPAPTRYFNDYAAVVDAATANRLNSRLEDYERESSNQLVVAVFPKLPENTFLEDFTVKTAQSWGVGGKKKDNGIVLFVFIADRKMRIEVGYGLEGRVPDSIAALIIANEIKPAFKVGNYGQGLERGMEALIRSTKGEYEGTGKTVAEMQSTDSGSSWWVIGLVILVLLIWIHMGDTVFQRGGRFVCYNLLDILRVILISSSSGSSRGGGGGGGGFGGDSGGSFSGGGGSFGGGGASGDW